jgi:glycine cleavage system H protein
MVAYPEDLRYTDTHEWVSSNGEIATVGLSAFAVEQLTDLIVIDLGKAGRKVAVGGRLGEVESVKSVNDIYAPLAGEIIEINAAVVADLELLSNDPYGSGWLVKIKPDDPAAVSGLLTASQYKGKVESESH